jgi:hypothetical protein
MFHTCNKNKFGRILLDINPKLLLTLTEHRGQALSAPLCIQKVPGSNPGASSDLVWIFSRVFPHLDISTGLISQIKANAGSTALTRQYLYSLHLPSAPILTVPNPNLPVIVPEKVSESLSNVWAGRIFLISVKFLPTLGKYRYIQGHSP